MTQQINCVVLFSVPLVSVREMKTRACVQSYEGYQILRHFCLIGVYGMSFITITEDRATHKRAYETIVPFDDKQMCYPSDNKTLKLQNCKIFFHFGFLIGSRHILLRKYTTKIQRIIRLSILSCTQSKIKRPNEITIQFVCNRRF
jgi:hypothetical protein